MDLPWENYQRPKCQAMWAFDLSELGAAEEGTRTLAGLPETAELLAGSRLTLDGRLRVNGRRIIGTYLPGDRIQSVEPNRSIVFQAAAEVRQCISGFVVLAYQIEGRIQGEIPPGSGLLDCVPIPEPEPEPVQFPCTLLSQEEIFEMEDPYAGGSDLWELVLDTATSWEPGEGRDRTRACVKWVVFCNDGEGNRSDWAVYGMNPSNAVALPAEGYRDLAEPYRNPGPGASTLIFLQFYGSRLAFAPRHMADFIGTTTQYLLYVRNP